MAGVHPAAGAQASGLGHPTRKAEADRQWLVRRQSRTGSDAIGRVHHARIWAKASARHNVCDNYDGRRLVAKSCTLGPGAAARDGRRPERGVRGLSLCRPEGWRRFGRAPRCEKVPNVRG